jgi:hypothetical protein
MRSKLFTFATVVAALTIALTGCRTITGRTAGTFVDDTTTTTKVKTAIASTQIGTLTRVDVDTRQGVVYLTGTAMSPQNKQQIFEAARAASEGKPVVDNVVVTGEKPAAASPTSAAASPSTETRSPATDGSSNPSRSPGQQPSAGQQIAAAPPAMAQLKFGRMERDADPSAIDRWAAYDQQGQRVATVYTIPAQRMDPQGVANLDAGERRIDHISIYPHPGSDGQQYHVVLWHVSRQDAARMQ